jgi:alanyl-tRNA synthetase
VTSRLYYTDAYLREFDARLVAADDDGHRVELDRTAFYPTSGGQPFDTGRLGDVPVVDVVDEGERIVHLLERPLAVRPGATVLGSIDWTRRFDHMQQHTGQHVLSAVFSDRFGLETVSVHFGAATSTLDLAVGALAAEQLAEAETLANAVVFENRRVTVAFEDAARATGLRKPTDRSGEIRIISIDGVDRSACGGTHVRATGEIGAILLRHTERIRQETRVEFMCGGRAIHRAHADYDALARVAQLFTAPLDEVPDLAAAQLAELKDARSALRRLDTELARYRAAELHGAATPDASGIRRIVERRPAGAADELRALGHRLAELPRVVFVGAVEAPPVLVLAASEDSGVDAGALLRRVLAEVGGRGGGSPRIAQGTVPDSELIQKAIDAIQQG